MLIVAIIMFVDSSACMEAGFKNTGDPVGNVSVDVGRGVAVDVGLGVAMADGVADGIGDSEGVTSIFSED
jgi:hypothetical protein